MCLSDVFRVLVHSVCPSVLDVFALCGCSVRVFYVSDRRVRFLCLVTAFFFSVGLSDVFIQCIC